MWEYFPKLKFQLTIAEFQLKIREILLNIPFLWSIFVCITNHWWYFIHAQLVIFKLLELYSRWNMRKIHIQKACIWIKELWTFLPPYLLTRKNFYELWPNWIPTPHRVLANGFDDLADKENPSQCGPTFFKVASNFLNTNKFDKLGTIVILRKGIRLGGWSQNVMKMSLRREWVVLKSLKTPLRYIKMVP